MVDFLTGPSTALSNSLPAESGQEASRHYLRQLSYTSSESVSLSTTRFPTHRDNAYPQPGALNGFQGASSGIFPNFDCKNLDYKPNTQRGDPETQNEEILPGGSSQPGVNNGDPPGPSFAPCVIGGAWQNVDHSFGNGRYPGLYPDP
jgi:hypothetical protein